MIRFTTAAFFLLLLQSCCSLALRHRAGKDEPLTPALLQGAWRLPADSNAARNNTLSIYTGCDSLNRDLPFFIGAAGAGQVRILQPGIRPGDTLNILLKGHYRKGYFITRRKWSAPMPLGPLLWAPGAHRLALGLGKAGQLVLRHVSNGALLVIAMPIAVSSGADDTYCIKTQ